MSVKYLHEGETKSSFLFPFSLGKIPRSHSSPRRFFFSNLLTLILPGRTMYKPITKISVTTQYMTCTGTHEQNEFK